MPVCELTAICLGSKVSFKQFPITYEHLHLNALLYPIMTTKIPLWWLNCPFSRTAHLKEGGGQEEGTNCASENYETEKVFAPFKKVLNQKSKTSSALENLRKKAYYMKSAWQNWYLRFPFEFAKRTKITGVHNTELDSNSSSHNTVPNYGPREKEHVSLPREHKRSNKTLRHTSWKAIIITVLSPKQLFNRSSQLFACNLRWLLKTISLHAMLSEAFHRALQPVQPTQHLGKKCAPCVKAQPQSRSAMREAENLNINTGNLSSLLSWQRIFVRKLKHKHFTTKYSLQFEKK